MIEALSNLIISLIHSSGYAGVFLLMTVESALIPVPSEVTMPFAGSLVSTGIFNFWILVVVGALANLTGSLAAYALGYLGEEEVVKFIRKYGKYFFIREKEFEHAQKAFNKHGEIIVLGSRVLPAIRTYISLPAGIARMDLKKFIIYTLAGSLAWSALLTYLGVVLGSNWKKISPFFHIIDFAVIAIGASLVLFFLYRKMFRRTSG